LIQHFHAVGKAGISYIGRFAGILADESCKGVRGIKLALKSVGVEGFSNGCFQGQRWEMCRWKNVGNKLFIWALVFSIDLNHIVTLKMGIVYSFKTEQTFTTCCQTPKKDCHLSNVCQYW
jgi:hypothetical protein